MSGYKDVDIQKFAVISLRSNYLTRVRGRLQPIQVNGLLALSRYSPCGGCTLAQYMGVCEQTARRVIFVLMERQFVCVVGLVKGKGIPAKQYGLTDSGKELAKYHDREWLRQLYALRLIRPNKNKLKGEPLARHNKMLEDEYKRYGIQI